MYFCQLPYMYANYLVQPYPQLNFYHPFPVFYDCQQNLENLKQEQKQQKTYTSLTQNEKSILKYKFKTKIIRKLTQKIQKQPQHKMLPKNDFQFKQRQQTANRNLNSNTLKVYFRQLRDPKTETSLNINKIIEKNKINMTHIKFMRKINSIFTPQSTYISFDLLKKKLLQNYTQQDDINFSKIVRTSIQRFYRYQIFTVNIKSAKTTRKIRNQQIKQGKILLNLLSL